MTCHPPGVSIDARPRYAPDLVSLHAGDGWIGALHVALRELHLYRRADPTLFLPDGDDPAAYRWPVRGRHVAIYGALPLPALRRLLAALMRDGAAVAVGLDADDKLHIATDSIVRRAA